MSRRTRPARRARRRRKEGFDGLVFDGAGEIRIRKRIGSALLVVSVCLTAYGLSLRIHLPLGIGESGPVSTEATVLPAPGPGDRLSGRFSTCEGPQRHTCVVDGDTFWFAGDRIRMADINTPETSSPECDAELALGNRATERLAALLNAGPFSLEAADRDTDRYGRKLRIVTRGGQSLGDVLIAEGLAESWQGFRGGWC